MATQLRLHPSIQPLVQCIESVLLPLEIVPLLYFDILTALQGR
ncbi:hypothetical protein MC7420_8027 [Coleofasciculus chthonoplastes PCC 7420]|uniref:Uncharacterized protein n=1 Tax=Coleofasciculus chthonoplastes PCC 7420 TaxID=118168 RepID=B4VJE1_9CYAN|nr:hypothetical protein MC7420_8027 [Coleofasciculus chthonoplastes PCC 7420]